MSFRECHVLNPYPEPQLKRYVLSHNSRNTSKSTFEITQKPCRPCKSQASKAPMLHKIAWLILRSARRNALPNRLARDACRQAPLHSLPLQVSHGGTTFTVRRHTFLLPSTFTTVAWRFPRCHQAPHQY